MPQSISSQELLGRAKAMHEDIRAWRREIHRNPELTFTEHHTAGLVNSTLVTLGIETETEVAKTGVVGHIKGGDGPLVGLRADMDALPIFETNGTEFDSLTPGIMHACGHDSHTAMLLGAATLLKGLADEGKLPGSVRLLFQPSEEAQDAEGKSGGMRMVEEGALEGLDAVFGLHVAAQNDVGTVALGEGPLLAAADEFKLTITGSGGHASQPQLAVDPIQISAMVIQAIHQIVSRRLDPLEAGVITISTIHAGIASNVIPDSVEMTGTIRSYTPAVRQLLDDEMHKAVRVAEAMGGSADLQILRGYPPTVNDPVATAAMRAATQGLLGEENVVVAEPVMGAEDFSYMAQAAPGSFLFLGVKNPSWDRIYPVHRADFRIDEDALPIGAASLAAAAIEWMETHR